MNIASWLPPEDADAGNYSSDPAESVVRSFVARRPSTCDGAISEQLVGQGGAWVYRWWASDTPFAAILDALPSVVVVPSGLTATEDRDMREFVWGYGVEAGLRVVMNNQCLEDLGLWTQDPSARSWCAQLRDRWRPPLTRVVLLADRVPDPRGPRHFFYAEPITSGDDLYRGVIEALYEESPGRVGEPKEAWLQRLRDDGVFCMDLVEDQLVNRRELAMARAAAAPRLADAVERLAPDGLLAIGSRTLEYVAPSAVALLNDSARVPFPAGAERKQFIAEVRRLVRPLLDRRGA